ncbi:hypothetical protein KOI35_36300 [Actinoplanes bogorensis]|uniref:Twin-arginine translocation signal domain-containing protein n=1 Tax=Paractinoplanes bogorensis TaxID=1610840 RepID=A0ABS5Z207_9ACTN|nr:hypothetical protein [Actinoplanes bogorensis]MBU2668988.1 hypothetical protein [Actinoplanes bogorensis]
MDRRAFLVAGGAAVVVGLGGAGARAAVRERVFEWSRRGGLRLPILAVYDDNTAYADATASLPLRPRQARSLLAHAEAVLGNPRQTRRDPTRPGGGAATDIVRAGERFAELDGWDDGDPLHAFPDALHELATHVQDVRTQALTGGEPWRPNAILLATAPANATNAHPAQTNPNARNAHSTQPGIANAHSTQPGTANAHSTQPGTANAHSTQPGTANAHSTQPGPANAQYAQPGTRKAHSTQPGIANAQYEQADAANAQHAQPSAVGAHVDAEPWDSEPWPEGVTVFLGERRLHGEQARAVRAKLLPGGLYRVSAAQTLVVNWRHLIPGE